MSAPRLTAMIGFFIGLKLISGSPSSTMQSARRRARSSTHDHDLAEMLLKGLTTVRILDKKQSASRQVVERLQRDRRSPECCRYR
jgi:replicative DNA helicase